MHNDIETIIKGRVYYRRHGGVCAMTESGVCYYLCDDLTNKKRCLMKGDIVIMHLHNNEVIEFIKD